MMTTNQKGAIAEAAITLAAVKLGIDVYRPVAEGGRYDLIFGVGSELVRVQCKWASKHGNVVIVRCRSCRRAREGLVHRGYTPDEVDAIAAYCLELDLATSSRSSNSTEDLLYNCGLLLHETTSKWGSTGQRTSTSPLD